MGKTLAKVIGPQAPGRRVRATKAPFPGLFPALILVNIFVITLTQNISMC